MPPSAPSHANSRLGGAPATSMDDRLNLSLDDLIESRQKTTKTDQRRNKRASVKIKQEFPLKKEVLRNKQQNTAKTQGEKRRVLATRNRGLETHNSGKMNWKEKKEPIVVPYPQRARSVSIDSTMSKRKKARMGSRSVTRTPRHKMGRNGGDNERDSRFRRNARIEPSKSTAKRAIQPKREVEDVPMLPPVPDDKLLPSTTAFIAAARAMRDVIKSRRGAKLVITLKRKSKERQVISQPNDQGARVSVSVPMLLPGKLQPKTQARVAQAQALQSTKLAKRPMKATPTRISFVVHRRIKK